MLLEENHVYVFTHVFTRENFKFSLYENHAYLCKNGKNHGSFKDIVSKFQNHEGFKYIMNIMVL